MHHKDPHATYKHAASQEQADLLEPNDIFGPGSPGALDVTDNAPDPLAGDAAGEAENAGEIPADLEPLCREHVCPTCRERIEAEQARLRALAEMENFKKRLNREHEEQLRFAAESVLGDLLPSLDNLDLALQYGNVSEVCRDMLTGVEMTRKLLLDAVKKHGLEPVGTEGEPFTPEVHEALTFEDRTDMEPGHVSKVLQRGYKLKERLLRPAKVAVSRLPS